MHGGSFCRFDEMIERSKDYIMSDQAIVSQGNSSLILEMATSVDKYIFTYMDVLSKVRVKRRENRNEGSTGFPESREKSSRISSML